VVPPVDNDNTTDDFYIQALLLAEVVKRILKRRGDMDLSEKPRFSIKPIVEFRKRIRVTGLEKFDEKTFISTINFYQEQEDLEADNVLGAVILYMPETYITKILQDLQYPIANEDDEEALSDGCGSFCNLIAGNFNTGLTQLGYQELGMSHFTTHLNNVVNGVEFSEGQVELYEMSFMIKKQKVIVTDLSMGSIPKVEKE